MKRRSLAGGPQAEAFSRGLRELGWIEGQTLTIEARWEGGLMSYGPSINEMFRGMAGCVDRILGGAKPGDLPIERPARFELVINLKTAAALGLSVPRSSLQQADELIG